jgi:hypothetical protein
MQTFRSAYMTGWECEWRRLLGYHAFDTGLSPNTISQPLATGTYIHAALEAMLKGRVQGAIQIQKAIEPSLKAYREYAAGTDLPIDEQIALVTGLAHAYGRIVLPWLFDEFEILDVEREDKLILPGGLEWLSRSDFTTRHKKTGGLAVHDFKSSASWSENRDVPEYQDSVQMMMNAESVAQRMGEKVEYYYIHLLLKGNDYAPSPLIHPYYRPANPPIQSADLQAYYKYTNQDGQTKSYQRINVWDVTTVPEWVWSMPAADCAKQTIVVGPYEVKEQKIDRFVTGAVANERHWQDRLALVSDWENWSKPAFQRKLDELFPRTYKCYTYGSRCAFYGLCHQHDGWETPLDELGGGPYSRRVPHHSTEEV